VDVDVDEDENENENDLEGMRVEEVEEMRDVDYPSRADFMFDHTAIQSSIATDDNSISSSHFESKPEQYLDIDERKRKYLGIGVECN
jgi:hypothetical protein